MRSIKLTIAYDGTGYKGWQVQKNGRTVQEEIEKAAERAFGKKIRLHGAGRTDAGVHAKAQVAHLKVPESIPVKKIALALNSSLPEDIAVTSAKEVAEDFHSRYEAKRKHYRYSIFNAKRKDPFNSRFSWRVPYMLDLKLIKKEAQVLVGKHDFKSFQAAEKKERTSVRKIFYVDIKKKGSRITIDIEGDGFLYNMVRNIVGTLIEIGRGYLPQGSMKKILKGKNRKLAGPTAPAKGLTLIEVKY
ncbi:tRNA pseudouridine(38-40) synthase TruA [Candidatus Omnitrophota bacterium]